MTSGAPAIHQTADGAAAKAQASGTAGFLAGEWTVTRRICDFRTGQVGSFRGSAKIRWRAECDSSGTLAYVERGELCLGSHRGPAGRSLLILDGGDGTAHVRFADGREFYRLDLRTGRCEATHQCREDTYHLIVTLLSADSFAETWRVTGPSKEYELQATYTRAGHTSSGAAARSGDPR